MQLFTNALLFEPQNISNLALLVGAMGWVALLVVLIVDVFATQHLGLIRKFAWLILLIVLPIIGCFIYALVSLGCGVSQRYSRT